jgi:predicted phage replisome organizer
MSEKKYFWLKLPTDFFKDRVMKKLKRMAGGTTYMIIYQKMLLLSLENEGNIIFENVEDSFESEMSLELDENVEDIQMTMMFLAKNDLINKVDENTYYMTQVPEMIGSETSAAKRMRKSRKSKSVTKLQNNVTKFIDVTNCYTEIEKEKDLEKEIEIEKEKEKEIDTKIAQSSNTTDIYDFWNTKNIIKHKKLTDKIKTKINTCLKQYSKDDIKLAIERYDIMLNDTSYKYCNYKWGLIDFLGREKGFELFLDDGSKWVNYCEFKTGNNKDLGNKKEYGLDQFQRLYNQMED